MRLSFLELPGHERRLYFEQAAARRGLSAVVLEKDFWVCWLLGVLFRSEFRESLVFKGGTVDGGRKRRRGDRVAAVQNGGAQPCRSLGGEDRGDSPDHTPFQREAQECTATWRFGARFAVRC